jgi:hypothetical protein
MSLGFVLFRLGELESGAAHLTEAISAYRAASQDLTRERAPRVWALNQMGLGAALQALGETDNGTARLAEAVSTYRDVLYQFYIRVS